MRVLSLVCAATTLAALQACGGGTPPPKDPDEAIGSTAKATPPAPGDDTDSGTAPAVPGPTDTAPTDSTPSPSTSASSGSGSSPASGAAGGDDPWMAAHQMPQKDVLKGVRPAQKKAQACFKAGEKRDPSASGEVKVRFVVTNDGAVRAWKDDGSSMSEAGVIQCVGELIKGLKFPKQKSPGDAYGVYTVKFGH